MEEKTQPVTTPGRETAKVPTHGNWVEERGFGQQTSAASQPSQYDLPLREGTSESK